MAGKLTPRDTPLRPGDEAPDFTLKTQDKEDWTLSAALARGPVVLCFYPMSFSGVCEKEMRCVTDEFERLRGKGAEVVGVSCDSFFVQKAWAESLGLRQTLLADMHREVCRAYGMYWPDLNVSTRGTFIIESAGDGARVRWAQTREIKDAMSAEDVIAALSG